jgi:hypothetical protein
MPEPPQPPTWIKTKPIAPNVDTEYKQQRYERLLDSLIEYTEDLTGADELLSDLRKGLNELAKPQLDTLEAINRIQNYLPEAAC